MKGYMGRFLFIDLTTRKYEFLKVDPQLFEEFIGGKGLGIKLLIENDLITHDPYSPENPLIFLTGPFTGTAVQTSARSTLVTKSPLTNTFLDSHVGGHWGPMLKRAGIDYIYITGKSKSPIYLVITPGRVEFEDATNLWGKGIFETERILKNKYKNSRIASIGPAGENLVRFACIGTDYYRQFGRGGSGAVMGSKKLKAIVVMGNEKIDYFDKDGFFKLNKKLTKDIINHPNRKKRVELGTMMWIRMGQEDGKFLPTRNFQDVQFEEYEKITSETMKKELNWKSVGCFNCAILCSKLAKWDNYELEGPEYETTAYLGSGCGIGDAKEVAYANYLVDDLGLDSISTGVVASFAMEAFEKGALTLKETDGLELNFGNSKALFSLIEKIAKRDGLGDLLAEGTKRASEKIGKGSKYYAIQIAGMELSGVNIKGCASMGLVLATSDFASHTRFWSATAEMNGLLTFENTPQFIKEGQDNINARNSLIVCDFLPYDLDRFIDILHKITGIKRDVDDLMKLGEKISNIARLYNIKNGRTRNDDTLPQRFFKEKHLSGIFKDRYLSEEIFSKWLDMYYEVRGWDSNGVPTESKLKELGIKNFL